MWPASPPSQVPELLRSLAEPPQARRIANALSLAGSCISVAAANLLQHRLRLLAAFSGIAVALLLLLLQIAVLEAARAKVTALYDDLKFDLAIVPDTYQFLLSFDVIDRVDLEIARATGDVADTFGLNVWNVHWMELPSKRMTYNFLIGLDEPGPFVLDQDMRAGWPLLRSPHAILADRYSQVSVGPVSPGTAAQIGDERVDIVGQFKLGLFFYAEGATITRNTNFGRFTNRDPRLISMGLIQLKPGISPEKARADLIRALPSNTLVMTRDQLLSEERAYFLSTKPIGIMLYISMIIACLVGSAIIVQVLSTEVSNRMNEYAVFKAMGADLPFVYGIGMAQAGLLGLGGLVPATLIGAAVLFFVAVRTHLEAYVGPSLVMTMLAITLVLSVVAGTAVVSRVQRADPAELF
jgi:putative ABC transport system permease protein